MKVGQYRDEVKTLLVKVDTRQEEMYYRISRIEKHLEKMNGSIARHEASLIRIKTIGMLAVLFIPITVNVIMRFF